MRAFMCVHKTCAFGGSWRFQATKAWKTHVHSTSYDEVLDMVAEAEAKHHTCADNNTLVLSVALVASIALDNIPKRV